VEAQPVDLEELVAGWRSAFSSAEAVILAAARDGDLAPADAGRRSRGLAEERAAAVESLTALAEGRQARPLLARLVATPREARRLLGLPTGTDACVFNVDGVLVASAALHADAWKQTFDELHARRIDRFGEAFLPFSRRADYLALIHGRTREEAVREFLGSRGLTLPEGAPDDEPGAETVRGLANRKRQLLLERLARARVNPYTGARVYLQLARDAGISCGVVSGSTHTKELLANARLAGLVDDLVDGTIAAQLGLARKPAPDMLLAACRNLGTQPSRTAVFETTVDGVLAARAGEFEFVVAVQGEGEGAALRRSGADLLVADLGEIVEAQLAA